MHLVNNVEFRLVTAFRRAVEAEVTAQVERAVQARIQAARDALKARYEPSAEEILEEALSGTRRPLLLGAVATGEHEYEELPVPGPLDGLSFTNDLPGEMHVETPAREPSFDLQDWISATPTVRPLEDVVTGTSERGPNPGSVGHVGRTVPAGERSAAAWDGTRLADAMGQKRLDRFDVADTLGVTRRAVGYWLSGKYRPAEKHRAALRALLGVEV